MLCKINHKSIDNQSFSWFFYISTYDKTISKCTFTFSNCKTYTKFIRTHINMTVRIFKSNKSNHIFKIPKLWK